ncbi:pupal cuticle protein G1A isoform X2 [Cephus cinctus]|uniref:Pupal cuticle protein G1A isoform X2 n=1 Tax=Cephus cinctus TaxID=211228 RepID=A0AAJ7FRR5_CEPCN|nr:pupal cuticle protein G1A isoform X2 [Cephus cinctus]
MISMFIILATVVAISQAGVISPNIGPVTYSSIPAAPYSSLSTPIIKSSYASPYRYPVTPAVATYSSAPAVSYSSVSAPVKGYSSPYSSSALSYTTKYAGPYTYSISPLSYVAANYHGSGIAAYSSAPAVSYSTVSAPAVKTSYASPHTYVSSPVAYSTKIGNPAVVAYATGPAVSYSSVPSTVFKTGYSSPYSSYGSVPLSYATKTTYAAPAVAAYSSASPLTYSSLSTPLWAGYQLRLVKLHWYYLDSF